ncbi:MAG: hypothetical protein ACXVAK_17100 [Vulcanimicrobiaceae bacterium]
MRPNSSLCALVAGIALAVLVTAGCAFAQSTPTPDPQTRPLPPFYVGLQALLVTGVHSDVAGSQRGFAPAGLLELGANIRRFGIRIEGIPPISLPQKPSAYYGQATPQLSLINGAVRFAVDPASRLRIGIGSTIINQQTPLPNINQIAQSRLAGVRYEAVYRTPMRGRHFFEAVVGGAPQLFGADHYIYSDGQPAIDKDERASEVDASISVGVRRAQSEVLFGVRTINFAAQFTKTGESADRNNGAGVMVELRRVISP